MTSLEVRAFTEQEPVIDQVYREVFVRSEDGCRFTLDIKINNKVAESIKLFSVSKPRAQQEAEIRIKELMELNKHERVAWRIVGDSESFGWSLTSSFGSFKESKTKKVKSEGLWSRFVNYFFLPEEEQFD